MKQQTKEEEVREQKTQTRTSSKQEKSTFEEVISSPMAKQVGRELVRGVFGVLFGKTPRRSSKRGGLF
jgi:hypothetical protein